MIVVLFCGLERAPTFLVPIINPPFADNSPHFSYKNCKIPQLVGLKLFTLAAELMENAIESGAGLGYNSVHRQRAKAP